MIEKSLLKVEIWLHVPLVESREEQPYALILQICQVWPNNAEEWKRIFEYTPRSR
jgi:hypothetical protein